MAAQHVVVEAKAPAACPIRATCKLPGPLPTHTVSKGQKWGSDSRLSGLHLCLRQMLLMGVEGEGSLTPRNFPWLPEASCL